MSGITVAASSVRLAGANMDWDAGNHLLRDGSMTSIGLLRTHFRLVLVLLTEDQTDRPALCA
jgi:hypothetical protein